MSAPSEIRTKAVFEADSAVRGAQRLTQVFDKLQDAANGKGAGQSNSGKRSSNAVWALKDFAEGRTMFALSRVGEYFKGGGTAAKWFGERIGGAAAVALVAAGHVQKLNAEIKDITSSLDGFSESSRKASRDSLFLTAGSGSATLGGSIIAGRERIQEGKEKQWDAEGKTDFWSNPGTSLMYGASKGLGKLLGIDYDPIGRAQQGAEMSQRLTAKDSERAKGLYSESLGHEATIASMQGPGGNPFEAKRFELGLQQSQALAEVRKVLGKEAETELGFVSKAYNVRTRMVYAEEQIARTRYESALKLSSIAGGGAAQMQKSLRSANERANSSRELLSTGELTMQEERAEKLKLADAQNDQRSTLMGRYLNADGSRRRAGAINRDFRRDRREEKLRNRFLRQYDRGGFDESGRRQTTFAQPASGLETGSLRGASMAGGTNFAESFRPRHNEPGGGSATVEGPAGKTIGDLHTLLDARLPKSTKK